MSLKTSWIIALACFFLAWKNAASICLHPQYFVWVRFGALVNIACENNIGITYPAFCQYGGLFRKFDDVCFDHYNGYSLITRNLLLNQFILTQQQEVSRQRLFELIAIDENQKEQERSEVIETLRLLNEALIQVEAEIASNSTASSVAPPYAKIEGKTTTPPPPLAKSKPPYPAYLIGG